MIDIFGGCVKFLKCVIIIYFQLTINTLKVSNVPTRLLAELNVHLKSVLSQWFSPQLMELYHVTWESPCDILEKVSEYEAVHPLRHWKDLKHRVGKNRRCFIFTHKAIPREPIVVLHAALTSEPSNKIQVSWINTLITGNFIGPFHEQTLLDRNLQERAEDINTAVFYSITSTQKGVWVTSTLATLFHFARVVSSQVCPE